MTKNLQLKSKNYVELTIEHENDSVVLIFPGGGYQYTSEREGEVVASKYRAEGFNTAIYHYREEKLLYPETTLESYEVLKLLKDNGFKQIFLLGFSAGGHLALHTTIQYKNLIQGLILAYPVISIDEDSIHQGSFNNLLGDRDYYRNEVSLEKIITRKLPPIYIWHTKTDLSVPISNSYKLVQALELTKTVYQFRVFEHGPHGLSLATKEVSQPNVDPQVFEDTYKDVAIWFKESVEFLKSIKK